MAWIALATAAAQCAGEDPARTERFFYRGYSYGSESQFNPISSFVNWSYDTLQVPESFDSRDFSARRREVSANLRHPGQAIERTGGWDDFVNRQIVPYKLNTTDWIPNYALHLLGGGMVHRKNVEWFEAHGYAYPQLYAVMLGIAGEFIQEVVEKKSTAPDDEVADFYIFRPAGMLLFSWDPFARFAAQTLRMAEWPYQPAINLTTGKLANVGQSFVVRPALFGAEAPRPFAFFGMTTLVGASHAAGGGDRLSWGVGAAVKRSDPLELRPSLGVFYDRNDSLLASLVVNTTDNLALRLNVHPGVVASREYWSPGLFAGIGRRGELTVGLTLRIFPLGIAAGGR